MNERMEMLEESFRQVLAENTMLEIRYQSERLRAGTWETAAIVGWLLALLMAVGVLA